MREILDSRRNSFTIRNQPEFRAARRIGLGDSPGMYRLSFKIKQVEIKKKKKQIFVGYRILYNNECIFLNNTSITIVSTE